MDLITNLKGSLGVWLILAGLVVIFNPEARKDALGVFAASMILAPAAVTFIWFIKKYPKPGTQFLIMFGLLGVFVFLAFASNYLGLETLRGVFVIGGIASVLLILTLFVIWVLRLGSKVQITGRSKDNMSKSDRP
tara:strand:- start:223 stop:627 length:405 start_codon:yes stop_codon:yes gene_type:complete